MILIKKKITRLSNRVFKTTLIIAFLFNFNPLLIAGPPQPGGVPLDGGVSFLIIAAVGYGAKKMMDEDIS